MRLVVADTSPLFYLLSIDLIELLPQLFERVFIPEAVREELIASAGPGTCARLGGRCAIVGAGRCRY
jgi:predicted nucleic acid-binding protein